MSHWKLAVVTGGGSGIGRRLAELLLRDGTDVIAIDRSNSSDVMAHLEAIANQHGQRCMFVQADVTDQEGLNTAISAAVAGWGNPDLAINCAGIQIAKPLDELTGEEFSRVVNINLIGSYNFAIAVLPHMNPGSQLALIASLAGLVPSYSYAAYNASKFGVVGLAGALRLECLERGIAVSVICPPEVKTPMIIEERKTLAPAGAKLKNAAGTLELEPACDYMFAKLQRANAMIIPGFRARWVARLSRWFPNISRKFSEQIVLSVVQPRR